MNVTSTAESFHLDPGVVPSSGVSRAQADDPLAMVVLLPKAPARAKMLLWQLFPSSAMPSSTFWRTVYSYMGSEPPAR
jgi:hypothetical protein